jgi:hypothetical protein
MPGPGDCTFQAVVSPEQFAICCYESRRAEYLQALRFGCLRAELFFDFVCSSRRQRFFRIDFQL